MLISGFTIVRNGVKFDYPFIESIQSALPICDEFVINVGESEDSTERAIQSLIAQLPKNEAEKIKTFKTVWPLNDPEQRKGGRILADQTNLALERCQGDWCLYLQADEVLHEGDLSEIKEAAELYRGDRTVDGFIFGYVHFYADYETIQTSRSSYRREIRMVRNRINVRSTGDAQSFRLAEGQKLNSVLLNAKVYHYGWVRPQEVMKTKTGFMDTLYHQNAKTDQPVTGNNYLYKRFVGLRKFQGRHPSAMQKRVAESRAFDFSQAPRVFQLRDIWKIISGWIERTTDWRPFEYKSYRLVKRYEGRAR